MPGKHTATMASIKEESLLSGKHRILGKSKNNALHSKSSLQVLLTVKTGNYDQSRGRGVGSVKATSDVDVVLWAIEWKKYAW